MSCGLPQNSCWRVVLVVMQLVALSGCASVAEIRVENASTFDFTDFSIAGSHYGDIPSGAITDYRSVDLTFGYVSMTFRVDGVYVTAESLNFAARRFTYRVHVIDRHKGWLDIEILRE